LTPLLSHGTILFPLRPYFFFGPQHRRRETVKLMQSIQRLTNPESLIKRARFSLAIIIFICKLYTADQNLSDINIG